MLKLIIRLCALSLGLSYATPTSPCQKLQQTQLTSLNERMNQMIEALYSSSIFSKPKTSSTENSSETGSGLEYASNTISYETPFYPSAYPVPIVASPTPQVIYVSAQPPPGLAYAPPSPPYSPVTLPSPTLTSSYYSLPGTSTPSSEYSYPVPTHYPWPQAHSYETYSKPPQVPPAQYSPSPLPPPPATQLPVPSLPVPSPPVTPAPYSPPPLPYSSLYSYPTTTPTYDYKYSYPEYPPPTVPSYPPRTYQSNPSQPPYSPVPDHAHPPPFYGYPATPMPPPAYPSSPHSQYTRYSELIPIPPPVYI